MNHLKQIILTFMKTKKCPIKRYISHKIGYRTVGYVSFYMLESVKAGVFPEMSLFTLYKKRSKCQSDVIKLVPPNQKKSLHPDYIEIHGKYVRLPHERITVNGRGRPEMLIDELNKECPELDIRCSGVVRTPPNAL